MTEQWVATRRLADVRTGKIVNSEPSSPADVEAPYVTAANVQPLGRVIEVEGKSMWFTPKELAGSCGIRAGDLLVVEGGAGFGRPGIVPDDFNGWGFQNHINRIRPRDDLADTRFLYYAFEHLLSSGQTAVVAQGATLPTLSSEKVRALRVPYLTRERQREVASFLDRETAQIDEVIEAQRELVAAVEARRKAVLTDTVFQGVGGQLGSSDASGSRYETAGFPPLALTRGLSLVPEDWGVVRFKVAMQRVEERNGDGEAILMSLTSAGRVVPRSETGDRQQPAEESIPRYLMVRPGHLIINPMWLTGGAIGVSWTTGAVSPDYRVFRSRGQHDPRYLHHLLRAPAYLDQYRLYTRAQTTFDRRVQQPDIDSLPLPMPTLEEQADIADHLDRVTARIDAVIAAANESIALMQERRAALISAAVTGRIDPRTGLDRAVAV